MKALDQGQSEYFALIGRRICIIIDNLIAQM